MTIYAYIQLLLNEGMKRGMIEPMDEIYVRNRILSLLQLDEFKNTENLKTIKINYLMIQKSSYRIY